MSFEPLIAEAVAHYHESFGIEPKGVAIAPGRINLIGEHTDYHEGFVFPAAIDRYVVAAFGQSKGLSRVVSRGHGDSGEFEIPDRAALTPHSWLAYATGTAVLLREQGIEIPEMQAAIVSDLPVGAGLSSSAATEVAMSMAITELSGVELQKYDRARLCQRSENEIVGVPCGLMDQLASVYGEESKALFVDIREPIRVQPIGIPPGLVLLACNSGEQHHLGDSGYPLRRRQSEEAAALLGVQFLRDATPAMVSEFSFEDEVIARRARYIVGENARCEAFALAMATCDFVQISTLMRESHEGMRDEYEITTPRLDQMAEFGWEHPACVGMRMTGGGFGGSCVALVQSSGVETFIAELTKKFETSAPAPISAEILHPSGGARAILS